MSADGIDSNVFPDQPISQLLVKVASRCNIDCSYCYWFRDAAVYDKPKLMSPEVLHQLLQRIEEHVAQNSLIDFPIILHGGEPLLWGVENFHRTAEACEAITVRTGCEIPIAVTTNGLLIDDEWLNCFEARNISVAISLDGPAHIHDIHRRTFQGDGTHAAWSEPLVCWYHATSASARWPSAIRLIRQGNMRNSSPDVELPTTTSWSRTRR